MYRAGFSHPRSAFRRPFPSRPAGNYSGQGHSSGCDSGATATGFVESGRSPFSPRSCAKSTACEDRPLRWPNGSRPLRAARAEGKTMRRDRPGAPQQPGSARRPGSGGPPHMGSAPGHALRSTEKRRRSRVPASSRAHPPMSVEGRLRANVYRDSRSCSQWPALAALHRRPGSASMLARWFPAPSAAASP